MKPNTPSTFDSLLLQATEQLSPAELESITGAVATSRERQVVPTLLANESALFSIISQALPDAERARLAALSEKRADETLTPQEHQELLAVQQKLEALHTAQVKAMADLAALRGTTLTALMDQLGVHFPNYT